MNSSVCPPGWRIAALGPWAACSAHVRLVSLLLPLLRAVVLAASAPGAAAATSRYVAPTGTGTDCSSAKPCKLEDAVNASGAGDEVVVKPGNYFLWQGLSTPAPITIRGIPGQPRPILADLRGRRHLSPGLDAALCRRLPGGPVRKRADGQGVDDRPGRLQGRNARRSASSRLRTARSATASSSLAAATGAGSAPTPCRPRTPPSCATSPPSSTRARRSRQPPSIPPPT